MRNQKYLLPRTTAEVFGPNPSFIPHFALPFPDSFLFGPATVTGTRATVTRKRQLILSFAVNFYHRLQFR